ncbi:MAG: amino acid ABC transporter permease [Gemmatimonadaceae bacterium]
MWPATGEVRRPAPAARVRALLARSVATPINALLTLGAAALAAVVLLPLARWALLDATWHGSAAECREAVSGACWAFVAHKLPFILFGLYPPTERWRPVLATALLLALIVATAVPRSWRPSLLLAWAAGLAAALWVMRGGPGLVRVPTRLWGGLPVTLMLTALGLAAGFPLGVILALGRRSRRAIPRFLATTVVEVVRGVPLIAVLYVAALVVPLAMPRGIEVDKLMLALAGVALFASAYLAEAVRAGLQMVPRGQREAALALGLQWWQAMRLVVLPQALRVVIPSFVSIAVGFFQDTSLVVIVGLFDLLNTARLAAQDPLWLGFHNEAYAFTAVIYFAGSAAVSRYGLWLERHLGYNPRVRALLPPGVRAPAERPR